MIARRAFAPHLPGEEGLWILVLGEMTVFAVFFVVFAIQRSQNLGVFLASRDTLHQNYGAVNTQILLASSCLVAVAVRSAREREGRNAATLFGLAALCGVLFAAIKIAEFGEMVGAGLTLTTNEFYTFYYMLTGVHLLHVAIGVSVLTLLWVHTRRAENPNLALIEGGGVFWHMVDLLWIVLFPLLYLIR